MIISWLICKHNDRKGNKSFMDWIMQVEKSSHLIQHPQLQLARAKAEGIVYKVVEGIPKPLTWETAKKRPCQVFSLVATKMHTAIKIY